LLTATVIGTGAGAVTESFGYNTSGEVTSYVAKAGSTSLLAIVCTRDALGRISEKDETIGRSRQQSRTSSRSSSALRTTERSGSLSKRLSSAARTR